MSENLLTSRIPLFLFVCADYDDGDHEDNVQFRFITFLQKKVRIGAAKKYFDIGDRVRGLVILFRV